MSKGRGIPVRFLGRNKLVPRNDDEDLDRVVELGNFYCLNYGGRYPFTMINMAPVNPLGEELDYIKRGGLCHFTVTTAYIRGTEFYGRFRREQVDLHSRGGSTGSWQDYGIDEAFVLYLGQTTDESDWIKFSLKVPGLEPDEEYGGGVIFIPIETHSQNGIQVDDYTSYLTADMLTKPVIPG